MCNKCAICGTEQKEIGTFTLSGLKSQSSINQDEITIPCYNIQLLEMIKGKQICNKCMDIYRKIYALEEDIDFSCGGIQYYADGRNLE